MRHLKKYVLNHKCAKDNNTKLNIKNYTKPNIRRKMSDIKKRYIDKKKEARQEKMKCVENNNLKNDLLAVSRITMNR